MNKNDFLRLKEGDRVIVKKNLKPNLLHNFPEMERLKGTLSIIRRSTRRGFLDPSTYYVEIIDLPHIILTRDMLEDKFKFGRKNHIYSLKQQKKYTARGMDFVRIQKTWMGATRYYVDENTRMEHCFRFSEFGYSFQLQRKRKNFGWKKVAWAYERMTTSLFETYSFLLYVESMGG